MKAEHTPGPCTEQSEKQQAIPSLAELDLRDYFAAKAMQGLAANPEAWDMTDEKVAEWAYNAADAMLKAREESND